MAFAIVSNNDALTDELLSQSQQVQSQIVDNLPWSSAAVAREVKTALLDLSQQKANGQDSYKRSTRGRLEKALESTLPDSIIDSSRLAVDYNDRIGDGSYGMVFGAKLRGVGDAAVKLIVKTEMTTREFFREVASLQLILSSSRNVLQLHGWAEVADPKTSAVYLALVTERCSRSLAAAIADSSFEPVLLVWLQWLQQTAAGMAVVAAKGMLHRDLKPDNVLITKDGRAVIADFGLAVTRSSALRSSGQSNMHGTPGFVAPEVFASTSGGVAQMTQAVDVYAFGVLALFALLRAFPW